LPLDFPAFPERSEFDLHALLKPAREVGGDFYDFFMISEDKICLVVGDVSGKGVPAALFMAVSQTMIKTAASGDQSPASIMTRVNDALSSDNPASMFVTVFLAIVDIRTGRFRYCNAGHNPPYIVHPDGRLTCLNQRHGVVMGAMPGLAYGEDEAGLEIEDSLLIFTDGVTEAMDKDVQLFDESRLENFLNDADCSAAQILTEGVLQTVEEFAKGAEQSDDITILAYRLQESPKISERNSLEMSIAADIAEIARIHQATEKFSGETTIPAAATQKMNIILDELLNNTISYGFDDPKGHEIHVNIELNDDHITLKIIDDGIPFNPFTHSDPDTSLSIDERAIGGLGVMLVKKLTDSQVYHRLSDRNVNTLTIKLESKS
jgi:sigma-B regulation protein RsbU (phosphoserine phosphatase)